MSLTFQEEGHVYQYDGLVVPSVTQVLEPLIDYSMVPDFRLAMAADRGTNVHKMCELHDYGTLEDYEPEYEPYLDAWIMFLEDTGFEAEIIETRLYHPVFKYAGAVDRVGMSKGKRVILDIKTTFTLMPAVGPQTAAYQEMWNKNNPHMKAKQRWAVQLKSDGTYRIERLKGVTDFSVFTSCLNIHNWRAKNV